MKKVASALVEFSSLEDLKRYISTVIKNVVSDQEKTRQSQPRILARQSERIAREEKSRTEQAEYEQNFKLAKEEFSALLSANERTRYYNKLQLLYNTIFEHKNDAELQAMFPDTSRATRDQWRKRARDFIWPNASDNLKLFLSKFTKKKFNR
ncbi:hypothetical protein HZA42_01235 [Candidatus Peregrinibacteria bacterium]|nr:hypothetical protein [Candidatus Peregrinibacteria bacterium]